MQERKYPQRDFSVIQTSTVLSCAGCNGEIKMFAKASTDGLNHWHEDCRPGETLTKTVELSKQDEGTANDKGEEED